MAQKIGPSELAESVMACNTTYSDAGPFGVYAVARVCSLTSTHVSIIVCEVVD